MLLCGCVNKKEIEENTPIVTVNDTQYTCTYMRKKDTVKSIMSKTDDMVKLPVNMSPVISNFNSSSNSVTTYILNSANEGGDPKEYAFARYKIKDYNYVFKNNNFGNNYDREYFCFVIFNNNHNYYFKFVTGLDYAEENMYQDLMFDENIVENVSVRCRIQACGLTNFEYVDETINLNNEQIKNMCSSLKNDKYLYNPNSLEIVPGANSCSFVVDFKNGSSLSFGYVDERQLTYNNINFVINGTFNTFISGVRSTIISNLNQ